MGRLQRLRPAASSVAKCHAIIAQLGKITGVQGQRDADNSGCCYHPGQFGWAQVVKKNGGDPECDVVNADTSRQRVCKCTCSLFFCGSAVCCCLLRPLLVTCILQPAASCTCATRWHIFQGC